MTDQSIYLVRHGETAVAPVAASVDLATPPSQRGCAKRTDSPGDASTGWRRSISSPASPSTSSPQAQGQASGLEEARE
jgi:hypothetical protein